MIAASVTHSLHWLPLLISYTTETLRSSRLPISAQALQCTVHATACVQAICPSWPPECLMTSMSLHQSVMAIRGPGYTAQAQGRSEGPEAMPAQGPTASKEAALKALLRRTTADEVTPKALGPLIFLCVCLHGMSAGLCCCQVSTGTLQRQGRRA